jgi:outer membrane biosynthesis protein TonB
MTFRQKSRIIAKERKDRRRGITYSILFHLALFLIMWFVGISSTDRSDEMAYIEIVFEQESGADSPEALQSEAAEAAPEAAASAEEEVVEEEVMEDAPEQADPVEEIELEQPEAQPDPADVETDLVTEDFSEIIAREREQQPEPEPEEEIIEEEIEEVIEEEPEPEPEPEPRPTPTPREADRPTPAESPRERTSPQERPRPTPGQADSDSDRESAADGRGESRASGDSDRPSDTAGDGRVPNPRGGARGEDRSQWSGMQGTGPLTRAVVHRGDSRNLAGEPGVIMIRLCIDRSGNIVFQEINESGTTIENTDLLRRAMDLLSTYRFETDQSAPYRECGNYTYRVNPRD